MHSKPLPFFPVFKFLSMSLRTVSRFFTRFLVLPLACSLASSSLVGYSETITIPTGPFCEDCEVTNLTFYSVAEVDEWIDALHHETVVVSNLVSYLSSGVSRVRANALTISNLCDSIIASASTIVSSEDMAAASSIQSDVSSICNSLYGGWSPANTILGRCDTMDAQLSSVDSAIGIVFSELDDTVPEYRAQFAIMCEASSSSGSSTNSCCCQCPDYTSYLSQILAELGAIEDALYLIEGDTASIYSALQTIISKLDRWDSNYFNMLLRQELFWQQIQQAPSNPNSYLNLGARLREWFLNDSWGYNYDLEFQRFLNDSFSSSWAVVLGLTTPDDVLEPAYADNVGVFVGPLHGITSNLWSSANPQTFLQRAQRYSQYLGPGAILASGEPTAQEVAGDAIMTASIGLLYRIQHLLTSNLVATVDKHKTEKDKEDELKNEADDAQDDVEDAASESPTIHGPWDVTLGLLTGFENVDAALVRLRDAIITQGDFSFILSDENGVQLQLGNANTKVGRTGVVKIVGDRTSGWTSRCLSLFSSLSSSLWYALFAYLAYILGSWLFRIVWGLGAIGMQVLSGDFTAIVSMIDKLAQKVAGNG